MASGTTEIRLYNTLTRSKDDFTPLDPDNVRMYVCGPTVYDYAHIGNARPVIVFDVLFRLLRHVYGDEHVTYVRNITDVDDKINARAARDYPDLPLNEAIRKVTEKTADQYTRDVAALGCLKPTFEPRATENIAQMQAMIGTLIQKGNAYQAGGEVLFDVRSMPDYGALSGRDLDEQQAGARVEVADHKRNPGDFVLWKLSDENEPGWESPWGRGRPGWHLECSAMSERYLWDEVQSRLSPDAQSHPYQFDIHGGGLDLIFPHHENEIAQSRCAHGTPAMASVWMHNGFLQVEGQKMSKSLGNFYTIHELLDTDSFGGRQWPGEVLRLAMLMTHYREPIDFSVSRLQEANSLWRSFVPLVREFVYEPIVDDEFLSALADELNTPTAITRLLKLRDAAKTDIDSGRRLLGSLRLLGFFTASFALKLAINYPSGPIDTIRTDDFVGANTALAKDVPVRVVVDRARASSDFASAKFVSDLSRFSEPTTWGDVLSLRERGVSFDALAQESDDRIQEIQNKDFAKADSIRGDLLSQGVQPMDYKDPETGKRRTKWEIRK